jgi:hypothetical protein
MLVSELRAELQSVRRAVLAVAASRCVEDSRYQPATAAFCRAVQSAYSVYQAAMDRAEGDLT